jgi:hypothetical protein
MMGSSIYAGCTASTSCNAAPTARGMRLHLTRKRTKNDLLEIGGKAKHEVIYQIRISPRSGRERGHLSPLAEDRPRVPTCQQCTTENEVPATRGSEVPLREVLHRYLIPWVCYMNNAS